MSSGNEGETPVEGWVHVGNSTKVEIVIEPLTEQTEPVIVHQGRYRLWKKPDGGLHLVYQRDDSDTADHMELPGQLLKLAQMAGEGKLTPMQLMAEVMKLRNGM